MKIHFIYPDVETLYYPSIYHGLASISAVLQSHGHETSLHHVKERPTKDKILDVIQSDQPDLIGFSATTNQITYVEQWAKWIKQEFTIPTICGGVHATLLPEEVLSFEGIDMVCRGEGEYPMLDLAQRSGDSIDNIQNLWIKKSGGIIKNDLRPLISPLDELPLPHYELFDCERIISDRGDDFPILASRGCPFSCTYCCNHALRKTYNGKGRYCRFRSVENVLDEIELLSSTYKIKHLTFVDDIFGLSKKWIMEFCEKYPERFGYEFLCNMRVNIVDQQLIETLKKANCTHISFGVESGNERLRKEILKRDMSNEQIISAFDTCRNLGIQTTAYNMIGIPHETPDMIEQTINLNRRLKPDNTAVFFFYPYPQTELWEICKNEGLFTNKHSTNYISESVLKLSTISNKELDKLYARFYALTLRGKLQSFHFLLRPPLTVIISLLIRLLGRRGITLLNKVYLKYRYFIKLLKKR